MSQTQSVNQYSTLVTCLYDEQEPVGYTNTHYSIFRSVEWLDVVRNPLDRAQIHDFAVIWDRDHDERVIAVIEDLYLNGLLSPIQFIGEYKGTLTIILAAKFYFHDTEDNLKQYVAQVKDTVEKCEIGDFWQVEVGLFDKDPDGSPQNYDVKEIVGGRGEKHYLCNIDHLWNLGTKDFKVKNPNPICSQVPPPIPSFNHP